MPPTHDPTPHQHFHLDLYPLPDGIVQEHDVEITMRDGVVLRADVYRPDDDEPHPVLVSVTPYGKDVFVNDYPVPFDELPGYGLHLGDLRLSEAVSFEAVDPGYWVPHGYAVVVADVRGFGKSDGRPGLFTTTDAQDSCDVVSWAAEQPWSTGKVAMYGSSYLAMAQWYAAALRPPGLAAIVPWEGQTDPYADSMVHGGIPETRFASIFFPLLLDSVARLGPTVNPVAARLTGWFPELSRFAVTPPKVEDIEVPALVCGSWSDQGLHSRGSLDGFSRLPTTRKWLFTHGRKTWATMYGAEALEAQLRFLDHVLKGEDNGIADEPPVRVEIRHTSRVYEVRYDEDWPPRHMQFQRLYLDSAQWLLSETPLAEDVPAQYHAGIGLLSYTHRFEVDTEVTGHSAVKLWVGCMPARDMDLFVAVRKLDVDGEIMHFEDRAGYEQGPVTRGWLRVSRRTLDARRSTPQRPITNPKALPRWLRPGQVVPVEIELMAASTFFHAGQSLQLVIAGHDIAGSPRMGHDKTINHGTHTVHAGGGYDSHLVLPVLRSGSPV